MSKTYKAFLGAVAIVATGCPLVTSAQAATVNYALTSDGASFVAASSYLQWAVNSMPNPALALQTMQNNLLTTTPTPWFSDGDTRYIFNQGDTNQSIEIKLGALESVNLIGAEMELPYADRYFVGPFSIEVSQDGTTWSNWGSPVTNLVSATDPVLIAAPAQQVQYVMFNFGPSGPDWGGGSALSELFVEATPLPPTWVMMLGGLAGLGFVGYRQSRKAALLTQAA
jgi:hypothetical protein